MSRDLPLGRALELEVLRLFRDDGFRVHHDPGTARPRRTDIFAIGHDMQLLIEVKDRKRAVDVGDIDALRARLGRTTPDVIGVIFTTGSITRGAIKEIESNRTRETLVFAAKEVKMLRTADTRLTNLLARKRHELRINGRAWFQTELVGDNVGVVLPKSTIEFTYDSKSVDSVLSKTDFAHAAFSLDIPDDAWGTGRVRLQLALTISTLEDLKDIFGYLHQSFGLSSSGAFTIHQSGACWHGSGVRDFLDAARNLWPRYRAAGLPRAHHSEDLNYFDQFSNGWLTFHMRQRVPPAGVSEHALYLFDTYLCIQLPGIPINTAPYVELCRYTGNQLANFRFLQKQPSHTARLRRPIELQVVGTAVRSDGARGKGRWVVGLIANNPFYGKKKLPRELEIEHAPLRDLLQMELILCHLRDHIEEGDRVGRFLLEGVETTDAQYVQIIRPFGTWNRLVYRVSDGPVAGPSGEQRSNFRIKRKSRVGTPRRGPPSSRID